MVYIVAVLRWDLGSMIISWRAQLGPEAVLYQHKGHVLVSKIADIFELIDNHNYKPIPTNSAPKILMLLARSPNHPHFDE